jgi:hypothetical protein
MAMETFSDFRKLWARIDTDLPPDNYRIIIEDSKIHYINYILDYNVSQFYSNKSLIISTASPYGQASFYGYMLLVAAIYSFCVIFILWILLVTNSDKKFDYTSLKWK